MRELALAQDDERDRPTVSFHNSPIIVVVVAKDDLRADEIARLVYAALPDQVKHSR